MLAIPTYGIAETEECCAKRKYCNHINKLRDSIKSLDINDKDSVYKYKAQYEEIMRPVYTTQYPLQRNSDIDDIISKDVNEILKLSSRL